MRNESINPGTYYLVLVCVEKYPRCLKEIDFDWNSIQAVPEHTLDVYQKLFLIQLFKHVWSWQQ